MATDSPYRNALIYQTSTYLLRYACTPVQWYPWKKGPISLARWENKPVLLSIGHSNCHTCEMMAQESFENIEIAQLMNELFINIKVDREEYPQLDQVYQTLHQLLSREAGGWPLTVLLNPDNCYPFFSGTYFPPISQPGLPAFPEVLKQMASYYHHCREQQAALIYSNLSSM